MSRRAAEESQPLYADDTDEEEQPTPKAKRTGIRKRHSEVHDDSGRAPLKTVNINDDAAEKRRRRQSHANPHKIHVVDREEQQQAEGSRVARQRQLKSVAQEPQNIQVSIDNYEEWMKLATDNKINAANSWNVALIDYFHDMSLLRNDDDQSINFQRASCTLDGCVKIWTSRVDSVNTETGKLLSNLATQGQETNSEEDEENPDEDDPSGDGSQGKEKKKRKHKPAQTLATNPETLQTKKLDLEFSVDPLFKKTSADFDEGGAGGLLMNHLNLGLGSDGSMRVIFDASDTMITVQEDGVKQDEPVTKIDFSEIRKLLPAISDIQTKEICPSLHDFSFAKNGAPQDEPAAFYADDTFDDDDDDDDGFGGGAELNFDGMDVDGTAPPAEEDFFTGADAINEDCGYSGEAWGGEGGEGGEGEGSDQALSHGGSAPPPAQTGPTGYSNFDPRKAPHPKDLVMRMDEDADGMMDYFDKNMLRTWAGPEHWKTRRVIRQNDDSKKPTTKRKAKEKEVFKIDFTSPLPASIKDTQKKLFAPLEKGSINLPKSRKKDEILEDNLLPDDMHFDARQLVTLFLKPKFAIKMRKQGLSLADKDDQEVDEAYWARGAAEAARDGQDGDPDDAFATTQGGGAVPFNTQFLHDDDDDNNAFSLGFDDPFPTTDDIPSAAIADQTVNDPEEQDLLAATQGQTRRVKPEFVKYSKRAKRVDVRKLKENIWKGLDIVVDKSGKDEDEDQEMEEPQPTDQTPTDPTEGKTFSTVLSGLQSRYPREKMEEISTSFCFICLLHLANEQGLKLDSGDEMHKTEEAPAGREDEEDLKMVGNIWDLKVYRDPSAFVGL